jgi:hypothetical protein
LFAARDGDGVDTFGNVGPLRYAVLSYYISGFPWLLMRCRFPHSFGQSDHGKLAAQKTGVQQPQSNFNPFAPQQQQQQQAQNHEQPFFTV